MLFSIRRFGRQLRQRLRAPTPALHARLSWALAALAASAETVVQFKSALAMLSLAIPPWVLFTLDKVVVAGALASFLLRLQVDWDRADPAALPDVRPPLEAPAAFDSPPA